MGDAIECADASDRIEEDGVLPPELIFETA
jgi:hypothetical protein